MKMSREWAMPNKHTFLIPPILRLVTKYVGDGRGWADPFSGVSKLAEYRNDLDPENINAHHHLEAEEFMRTIPPNNLCGVLFDPPYSVTQVSRAYKEIGTDKFKCGLTGSFPMVRRLIAQKVKLGGYVISCGWNTVGIGITQGFSPAELLVVCHGGGRNDTLVLVERKEQGTLESLRGD
jgi:hypothetical protein